MEESNNLQTSTILVDLINEKIEKLQEYVKNGNTEEALLSVDDYLDECLSYWEK